MSASSSAGGFDSSALASLDEPVRRYLTHAIRGGAELPAALELRMRGRIRVGAWLPFTATQVMDGRSFVWQARVGAGPLTLLRVVDRYAAGRGRAAGASVVRRTDPRPCADARRGHAA